MTDTRTPYNNVFCARQLLAIVTVMNSDGMRVIKSNSGKVVRAYISEEQFKEGPLAGKGKVTSNAEMMAIQSEEAKKYEYKLDLPELALAIGSEEELQKVLQNAREFKPVEIAAARG